MEKQITVCYVFFLNGKNLNKTNYIFAKKEIFLVKKDSEE